MYGGLFSYTNQLAGPPGNPGHGATLTTGSFVIAAVNSTQGVTVSDVTAFPVNTYLLITDGTHTIVGLVTVITGSTLTVKTVNIVAGSAGQTMATSANVTFSGPSGSGATGATGATGAAGATGADGISGAYTVANIFTVVDVGLTQTITVVEDVTSIQVGSFYSMDDGANRLYGKVTAVSIGGGTITLKTVYANHVGGSIDAGTAILPAPGLDYLTGSATLTFGSLVGYSSVDRTITVAGARSGDPVLLGIPANVFVSNTSGVLFNAWVSANDTVTVRAINTNSTVTAVLDPVSFTVKVFK